MSPELAKLIAGFEEELTGLQSQLDPLRVEYDKLAESVRPTEEKMREIESQMDAIKPRHRELTEKLVHLRKVIE